MSMSPPRPDPNDELLNPEKKLPLGSVDSRSNLSAEILVPAPLALIVWAKALEVLLKIKSPVTEMS